MLEAEAAWTRTLRDEITEDRFPELDVLARTSTRPDMQPAEVVELIERRMAEQSSRSQRSEREIGPDEVQQHHRRAR